MKFKVGGWVCVFTYVKPEKVKFDEPFIYERSTPILKQITHKRR